MSDAAYAGSEEFSVCRVTPTERAQATRALPVEAPIAISFNGTPYAVMLATPLDLEDFGVGFALSERIASSPTDILGVTAIDSEQGWLLMLHVTPDCMAAVHARVRNRTGDGSCGLCGLESLAEVNRPLPPITASIDAPSAAIFAAINALREQQPLNTATGGVHAAAACDPERGKILLAREDVGRHNALDKLIGALARSGQSPAALFFLLSSRCSYELVEKTATAGCPLLVTVSTATTLAANRARACGLQLIALARADAYLAVSGISKDR